MRGPGRSVRIHAALGPAALTIVAIAVLTAILIALSPTPSSAQGDIFTYAGPDRSQRILDGAKKEGTVTLYSSATVTDMGPQIAAFEKKYGIKVRLWRAASEDITRRVISEQRAGRFEADIVETAGSEMEVLVREKALQRFLTPISADLIPAATFAHRQWIATRINAFGAGYNTKLISAADAPKRYEDLLDPKWKGKLAVEASDANWFMQLAAIMGEDTAVTLFRNIVARNGVSVRKGHSLLANLVPTGEVPLALTLYGYRVEQLKSEGAPIEVLYLPPVIGLPTGTGIVRNAPHSHAAALLADFFLTDAQPMIAERFNLPVNPKVRPVPENLALIDAAKFLDEGEHWTKLYASIFTGK
jgi:iron(III) transport system substrate-binding protein